MRTLCQRRGWSQNDLAIQGKVRPNTLSSTLLGRTSPRLDTLEKLASALGVPLWRFFVTDDQASRLAEKSTAEHVAEMAQAIKRLERLTKRD